MENDDDGVLGEHKRYGTKFVPSFIDNLGDTLQYTDWQRKMLPDFIWISLLLDEFTPRISIEIISSCSEAASEVGDKSMYLLLSKYDTLDEEQLQSVKESLDDELLNDLESALSPLSFYYTTFPLLPLLGGVEVDEEEAIQRLERVVDECYNRRSKTAVLAQAVYVSAAIGLGQLRLPPDFEVDDVNAVIDYPETDESRRAGSTVRAMTSSLVGLERESVESDWAERFWQTGFDIGECWFPKSPTSVEDIPDEIFETLLGTGVEFDRTIREAAVELWETADRNIEDARKESVLDGLLMRQINFAATLATSPKTWNVTLGNIIIRCMVDTQITLAWFDREGSEEDYEMFIEHGLGQEKLAIEHAESYAEDADDERSQLIQEGLEEKRNRLEEQKFTFLISVDVGAWNKSTRDMAIEADLKEIYDLSYSPKSDIVHGMWNSIENENLVRCGNPLHMYHRIPNFYESGVVPFCLVDAGNMLNRSLETWINARNADPEGIDIPDLSETAREILSGEE